MPDINIQKYRFAVLLADKQLNAAFLESQLDPQQLHLVFTKDEVEVLALVQILSFNLILLAFNNSTLALIERIKSPDGLNRKTPVIALMNADEAQQKQALLDAGCEDCMMGTALEKPIIETIESWRDKQRTISALNYIQIIQNKTKNNQRLTRTIFNKLFEELPCQIEMIHDALQKQHFKLAEETVHKLHGSASLCDLEELRAPAYALESCLIDKNFKAVNQHFQMLQACTINFINHKPLILDNLLRE
jgi:CheY-like chemotaxis protein